ncbi:DNA excision repair protein ERCC-1 [Nematocida major]|uniref:DNA excision repair protein ERCC-1 n=1 Tax=Nematocida major TaxID=1912982 RepID=UPI0020077B64|nr:DNA excision repair protein ERCC-1 [Nematocida major]KAH9385497.1 DNA excision repair protein ERCC-1 [Nematocida major]
MKVSELQKGNQLIKCIRRINIEYRYSVYDYEPGEHFGVIHVSLMLHMHSPQYVFGRIEKIKASQSKRVPVVLLLINADIFTKSIAAAFSKLQVDCMALSVQIIPAHTPMECARYIENMHLQKSDPGHLRNYKASLERAKRQIPGGATELEARRHLFLTAIQKVTKTDAVRLLSSKTIREISNDSVQCTIEETKSIGKSKKNSLKEFFMQKFN